MHHAAKDWAQGGRTDIDQLAPACDVHNNRVGPKPGQYTTRIITDGPDTGRVAWRLNTAPGMPPNPEHINRAADASTASTDHATDDTMASVTRLVPRDTHGAPPTSVIDHRLHTLLGAMTASDHHDRDTRDRDNRVDITWHPPRHPDHGHDPDPLAA